MEKLPPVVQSSLFLTANQGLFSNNYIAKHLPTSPVWSQHDAKLATVSIRNCSNVHRQS